MKLAEKLIFEYFEKAYEETHDWDSEHSIWKVTTTSNNFIESVTSEHVKDIQDPYAAIDEFVELGLEGEAIMVMLGWAAPTDDDGTPTGGTLPSKHPERIRVRLFVYLDHGTMYTAMHLRDRGIDVDLGSGTGPLADSINEAINRKKNHK